MKNLTHIKTIIAIFGFCFFGTAQEAPMTLKQVILLAQENNAFIKSEKLRWQQAQALQKTAFDFGKTEVYFNRDENNLAPNNEPLQVWGVQQSLEFPTVYAKRRKLKSAETNFAKATLSNAQITLERQVSQQFYNYQTACQKVRIYQQIDSIYKHFSLSATRKFELGESNYLEKITASAKHKQVQLQLTQSQMEKQQTFHQLQALVQSKDTLLVEEQIPEKLLIDIPELENLNGVNLFEERAKITQAELGLERHRLLPDLNFNLFTGTNSGISQNYRGFQVGVQVPIFFWGNSGRIRSAKLQTEIAQSQTQNNKIVVENRYKNLKQTLEQEEKALKYYESEGNHLSDELLKVAHRSFSQGEIDYFQYIQSLENAYQLKVDYLQSLNNYNQTLLQLHYLMYEDELIN